MNSNMFYLTIVFTVCLTLFNTLSISLGFSLWSDLSTVKWETIYSIILYILYILFYSLAMVKTRHNWYHCAENTDNSIYCNWWWQFIVLPGPDGRHAAYKTVWASERCHTSPPYKMWYATANLNTWIIFTQYYVLSQLN